MVLLFRRYNDEVLYDVSMHVGHLLLGRLSQFDIRVVHDRFKNRYLFVKDDQLKLKRESKAEGSENANLIMSLERKEKSDSVERERIKKLTKNGEEKKEWRKKIIEMRVLREKQKKQVSFYTKKKMRPRVIFIVTCLCLYFCTKRPI